VEVVKGAAPGKLSYKDSVIEAEEAWRALHRRRRKTGLVPRSTTRAAAPVTASGATSVLSGEDDDVSFLPVTADPIAGDRGAESPESDTDDREGQVRTLLFHCLAALPRGGPLCRASPYSRHLSL
jgi:hypothetical protein